LPVPGFSVNTNSDTQIWNSNGSGCFSNRTRRRATSYQIAGTADFNADGEAGILWHAMDVGMRGVEL
jgi:hypothetical protein